MKKAELIEILVEQYGYDAEDLKFNAEGNPYTNAKLQALITAEENDARELAEQPKRVVAKKNKFKDSDMIPVMCGLTGAVVYHSARTNKKWQFDNFGQIDHIEYSELLVMRNSYSSFFNYGWLVILDKDVQDEFGLTEMYKNILTPDNVDEIFAIEDTDKLGKLIDRLPQGMKTSFANIAVDKFQSGQLNNFAVITYLQNKFNFDFTNNTPLNEIVSTAPRDKNNVIVVEKAQG